MIYCAYDKRTGVIRACFDTPADQVAQNILEGEGVYFGKADDALHRVDITTGQLVSVETLDPGDGSIWNQVRRRWIAPADMARQREAQTKEKIRVLEAKQHRRVRELLAESDPQLQAIEDEIAELRVRITRSDT